MVRPIGLVVVVVGLVLAHEGDEDEDHHDQILEKPKIDNGQIDPEVDLPPNCRTEETWETCPEWTCPNGTHWAASTATNKTFLLTKKADFGGHKSDMIDQHQEELYPNSGYPNGIPASGFHRPKWPEYGEYTYIPPLRYVHALEHGAVLFLYHPCAPEELVKKLRALARGCLWKHLIFAFKGSFDPEYPIAMVSYGTVLKISSIDDTNFATLRQWIRKHAKIGANDEGRVFGNGTYNLLLEHPADIVTVIEDSEICPGPDTIDTSLFEYKTPEVPEEVTEPRSNEEPTADNSNKDPVIESNPVVDQTPEVDQGPVSEEVSEQPQAVPSQAPQPVEPIQEAETVPTAPPSPPRTEFNPPTQPTAATETEQHDTTVEQEAEPTVTATATTSTRHQLIVGTPPEEYDIDSQYDYDVPPMLDTPEAQQEKLIQIKRSESFWAFLSCTVLVVGLTCALYKSQLCRRKHKGYMRNNDHWTEDDQSISVGTLVRNLRRKKSLDETQYTLLNNVDEAL